MRTVIDICAALVAWVIIVITAALSMWWWNTTIIGTGWWTGWERPTWWQAVLFGLAISVTAEQLKHGIVGD